MLNGNSFKVNVLDAADIDCGDCVALGIDSLTIGMYATGWAKAMLDDVFIERVGAVA